MLNFKTTLKGQSVSLIFLLILLMFGAGSAQSLPLDVFFAEGKTEEGFAYMAGGFGIGERDVMEEQSDDYNLKLIFAENSGIYLADVKLTVENENGQEIVNTTAPGPWFYIQLPPGRYDVTADFEGEVKKINNISVSESRQASRIFHWDLPSEPEHPQLALQQNQ